MPNLYRTDPETIERIYTHLRANRLDSAIAALMSGANADSPEVVTRRWIGVQCDINNTRNDPYLSEAIAHPGVEYALSHGLKREAAVLLHNVFAFHAKDWDENVDPTVVPGILKASRRQVALRAELDDSGSFAWALWDLGMCELLAGDVDAALSSLGKAEKVHLERKDLDGAAWARLFAGKTLVRHRPSELEEGRAIMLEAAGTIEAAGEEWERAELPKIMASAGIAWPAA